MTSSCLKLNNLLYLLVKKFLHNSYTVSQLYTSVISILSETSCLSLAQTRILLHNTPTNHFYTRIIFKKLKEDVGMSKPKSMRTRLGGTQNLTNHFHITLHKYSSLCFALHVLYLITKHNCLFTVYIIIYIWLCTCSLM